MNAHNQALWIALFSQVVWLLNHIVPIPPSYTPALQFDDARNSMYIGVGV